MTTSRNTKTTVAAIKLGIFVLVSVIVTGTLTAIMGSFAFGSEREYKADFTSASMLKKGDDVRVAGVTVGSVKKVEIKDRDAAEITFKVKKDVPLTTATRASIRYLNLVGDRYMALDQGRRAPRRLPGGATIPASHTTPGAQPDRAVQRLPAAVPGAHAQRGQPALAEPDQGAPGRGRHDRQPAEQHGLADQLPGRPRPAHRPGDHNLSSLLKTVDDHHQQLSELVVQLKNWMTNVADDRNVIGQSVSNLSGLTAQLATLLTQGRPYIKSDVAQLRRVMTILNKPKNQAVLDEVLNRLPAAAHAPDPHRHLRLLVPVLPLRLRRRDHPPRPRPRTAGQRLDPRPDGRSQDKLQQPVLLQHRRSRCNP